MKSLLAPVDWLLRTYLTASESDLKLLNKTALRALSADLYSAERIQAGIVVFAPDRKVATGRQWRDALARVQAELDSRPIKRRQKC